eukprot:360049-Chlamydomonas_euryale.AAC.9
MLSSKIVVRVLQAGFRHGQASGVTMRQAPGASHVSIPPRKPSAELRAASLRGARCIPLGTAPQRS